MTSPYIVYTEELPSPRFDKSWVWEVNNAIHLVPKSANLKHRLLAIKRDMEYQIYINFDRGNEISKDQAEALLLIHYYLEYLTEYK